MNWAGGSWKGINKRYVRCLEALFEWKTGSLSHAKTTALNDNNAVYGSRGHTLEV